MRVRKRNLVTRIRARHAAIRIRAAVAAIDHTACCGAYPVGVGVVGRGAAVVAADRGHVHIQAVRDSSYPVSGACSAFNIADGAVRHPYTPFADVSAVVGQVNTVHHLPFVAVDIHIAEAADIVDLRDGLCPE